MSFVHGLKQIVQSRGLNGIQQATKNLNKYVQQRGIITEVVQKEPGTLSLTSIPMHFVSTLYA